MDKQQLFITFVRLEYLNSKLKDIPDSLFFQLVQAKADILTMLVGTDLEKMVEMFNETQLYGLAQRTDKVTEKLIKSIAEELHEKFS